jgi:hypothetical protein
MAIPAPALNQNPNLALSVLQEEVKSAQQQLLVIV